MKNRKIAEVKHSFEAQHPQTRTHAQRYSAHLLPAFTLTERQRNVCPMFCQMWCNEIFPFGSGLI